MRTVAINKISKTHYSGPVYNLELHSDSDVDDLFWVEQETGIVSHNCFPKDVNGFFHYAASMGYDLTLMKEVWASNLKIRKDIDWAHIKGAVTESKK